MTANKRGVTNNQGICYFKVDQIKNITYAYLGDRIEKIIIDDPDLNDIQIHVRDLDLNAVPEYFVNEIVVATRRKIVIKPTDPERKFRIKRSRSGIKRWE